MPAPQPRPVRPARADLDGVLLVDKPAGLSSNQALQHAKHRLNAAKAGHTGTLDPLASGLLVFCFGQATRYAQFPLEAPKSYEACVRLGTATATGDAEGEVVQTAPVAGLSRDFIESTLGGFVGSYRQTPPMYSALKRDGVPLYRYARAGVTVERAPREVEIEACELLDWQDAELKIRVVCGKGTYVRTLAEDLGVALGTVAHLGGLRRLSVGPFRVESALRWPQLEDDDLASRLMPAEALVAHLARLDLDALSARRLSQGQGAPCPPGGGGAVRLYDPDGRFMGVGHAGPDGQLRVQRLMARVS